jgi:xylulose-5-phosphate/fructose-6-phosphate phosphoketolase
MDAMVAKAPADPDTLTEDVENLSISPYGPARTSVTEHPLSEDEVRKMTNYFHASLYMCLGMIYLRRNPLLRDPLTLDHLKRRLLGHWGSDAGQSFTYIHMVRVIPCSSSIRKG